MPAKRSTTRRTTRTKRPLTPRTPSRIKKRTRRARSHHHPELWGLGMVAVGVFLVAVIVRFLGREIVERRERL